VRSLAAANTEELYRSLELNLQTDKIIEM
jgi:hypothetical protein